jgi:hypothetical protein
MGHWRYPWRIGHLGFVDWRNSRHVQVRQSARTRYVLYCIDGCRYYRMRIRGELSLWPVRRMLNFRRSTSHLVYLGLSPTSPSFPKRPRSLNNQNSSFRGISYPNQAISGSDSVRTSSLSRSVAALPSYSEYSWVTNSP